MSFFGPFPANQHPPDGVFTFGQFVAHWATFSQECRFSTRRVEFSPLLQFSTHWVENLGGPSA